MCNYYEFVNENSNIENDNDEFLKIKIRFNELYPKYEYYFKLFAKINKESKLNG